MDPFYFKKLDVYDYSSELVEYIYRLLKDFPSEEKYALCSQFRRAVISIPSNIAEGFGRVSSKEKIHFIEIAYGSLMEVFCQLELSQRLGYVSEDDLRAGREKIEIIAHLLSSLRFSIIKNGESHISHKSY